MKRLWIVGGCLLVSVVCFVLWFAVASDYGDGVASGTYHFVGSGQTSTLVLKSDRSFQQELSEHGEVTHATGTWRRIGEAGLAFSKEFLLVCGQEPGADGTPYADIHKDFGFLVSIIPSQYHVLWYGRVNPSPSNTVFGRYVGDEPGVAATLILNPDHTFEQVISALGVTKQSRGKWSVSENRNIIFSKDFLKASGVALSSNETASAWEPSGSNLQIQIAATCKLGGEPIFRKKQFF